MDHRKYLGRVERQTLPYLGGPWVNAPGRRLRVANAPQPGWWSFDVQGRNATPVATASGPELATLPRLRGHMVDNWLVLSNRDARRLYLMEGETPEVLSPGTGRIWAEADALFEGVELESEVEGQARQLLLDRAPLGRLKHVPPSLRAAFGWAFLHRAAWARTMQLSLWEVAGALVAVADEGQSAAERVLDAVLHRRNAVGVSVLGRPATALQRRRHNRGTLSPQERAVEALSGAGAALLEWRMSAPGLMEVTFRFMDEQFICVVDPESFQVLDAGICLSGHDRELGLDSLPGVIREAIERDELNITRY